MKPGDSADQPITEPVLAVRRASFAYDGRPALDDVDLIVNAGEAVALIGPNGAGKSTLLKGILGEHRVSAGSVRVLGIAPGPRSKARVGYLPQQDTRQRDFPVTVSQAVLMGRYRDLGWLRPAGRRGKEAVREALERVGLAHLAHARFGSLSGGQQQRVILARALVSTPALLLLDEPFNGLDRENRDALITILEDLKQDAVAVVLSTHDLELASAVCDRILLLDKRPLAYGTREEVARVAREHQAAAGVTADNEAHHDDHEHDPEPDRETS